MVPHRGRRGRSMYGTEPVLPSPDPSTGWPAPAAPGPAAGGRRLRTPLVAGAVVSGVFAIGLGVAYAQTDPSTATTAPTPAPQVVPAPAPSQPPAPQSPAHGKHLGGGHGPFGGKLFGPGHFGGLGKFGGIHGEFTLKKPDGSGFQTWATQLGEVTEVSSSSITVKSEDGFSRTYTLEENTVVNAGRD